MFSKDCISGSWSNQESWIRLGSGTTRDLALFALCSQVPQSGPWHHPAEGRVRGRAYFQEDPQHTWVAHMSAGESGNVSSWDGFSPRPQTDWPLDPSMVCRGHFEVLWGISRLSRCHQLLEQRQHQRKGNLARDTAWAQALGFRH